MGVSGVLCFALGTAEPTDPTRDAPISPMAGVGGWGGGGVARGDKSGPAEGTREDELAAFGAPQLRGDLGGSRLGSGFTFLLLKLTRNRMSIGR